MNPGYIVLIVVVAIGGWIVLAYNGLVRLRIRAEEAWRDIDTQLKRRWDLIPNLVATVKGYATHEEAVFREVTEARARAVNANGPAEQAAADAGLAGALKTLFAVAENYPELKANTNFLQLQGTLETVEQEIERSRRYYNAVVRDYNTRIAVFPNNLISGLFRFQARDFYKLEDAEQRESPEVSFE